MFIQIKMADLELISSIVEEIEKSELNIPQILEKYNITFYKYEQIRKQMNLKKGYVLKDNRRVKTTPFTRLLSQFVNGSKDQTPVDETSVNMEEFQKACKDGKKITELMEDFKLSLYQVRELKKKLSLRGSDLKTD